MDNGINKLDFREDEVLVSIGLIELDKRLIRMLSYLYSGFGKEHDSIIFRLEDEEGQQRITIYSGDTVLDSNVYTESMAETIVIEITKTSEHTIMREKQE